MKTLITFWFLLPLFAIAQPMPEPVQFKDVLDLTVRQPDEIVRYGDAPQQFGELWLPQKTASGLVIFIHGGCWQNQFDVSHSRALANGLTKSGLAVWSIEYRRLGDTGGGLTGTFDDIELATASVSLLRDYNVNVQNITIAGHSAGGHLALWVSARHPDRFNSVVGIGAITDLAAYAKGDSGCELSARQLMGGTAEEHPERFRQYSPHSMEQHPDSYLIQGERDPIVPVTQAHALGLPANKVTMTPGGHFDLIHPETQDFATVRKIISETFQ